MASIFKMKQPVAGFGGTWREGTPLGNGRHGALMYGKIRREQVMLMHACLWREGRHPDIPDVSDVLPRMRQAIFNGELPDADRMLVNALRERGYNPGYAYMKPAADLNIDLPTETIFKHYGRELDMETGEGTVHYDLGNETVVRRAFVSRADDVIVVECHKDSHVSLSIHKPDVSRPDPAILPTEVVTRQEGEWLFFKGEFGGVEHGAVARVIKGETTLIIARLYYEGTHDTAWDELKQYVAALPVSYDELLARHAPLHRELFNRCRFELGDDEKHYTMSNEELLALAYEDELPNALTQRMWDYGRYLFICGTEVGGYPCNLTGIWSGDYRASWSFNMANINLEMIYWHVLPGNLTELMLPVFDYYENGMDDLRQNARQIYGCRGIFLPAVTMPGAMKNVCMGPHIVNWVGGAGWIAQLFYDYYLFTKDEGFLRDRALPFMREAAAFYSDFIVRDGDEWHVCPSVSSENRTELYRGNPVRWPGGTQSSIDATMDVAIIKDLMLNLLQIADSTDLIPEAEAEEYRKILAGAPEYQVNEFGAPREWLSDEFADNDKHRHQSHLFPMFPGFEKARVDDATDALYRQGGVRRMTAGVDHQTSWSMVQNANMMARCRDGELALQSLNVIAKTSIMANLFTTHNDWRGSGLTVTMPSAPFQIDANIGWPSAVIEMLLFSYPGRTDILPALPKKWTSGKIGALRTRCGTEITIEWGNGTCRADLVALRDTEFDLYLPDGSCEHVAMKAGEALCRRATIA